MRSSAVLRVSLCPSVTASRVMQSRTRFGRVVMPIATARFMPRSEPPQCQLARRRSRATGAPARDCCVIAKVMARVNRDRLARARRGTSLALFVGGAPRPLHRKAHMPNPALLEQLRTLDDSAPLLQVRRLSDPKRAPESRTSADHMVPCPLVGREVVAQRCDFCAHGQEWLFDQATGQRFLRCSYLARAPEDR